MRATVLIPEPTVLDFGDEDVEVAVLDATRLVDLEIAAALFLTDEEHREYARLQRPPRRLEWLGARICLKSMLLRRRWIDDPRDCAVVKDPRGRPRLARLTPRGPNIDYDCSLSHKDRFVCTGLSSVPGIRLGVDVEKISPRLTRLAAAFADDRDVVLGERSAEERLAILWALKEACTKVLGRGLAMSLLDVTCEEIAPGRHRVRTSGAELRGRHLAHEGYVVAFCVGSVSLERS